MPKMFAVIALGLVLALAGCDTTTSDGKNPGGALTYFQDTRTGICFAKVVSITKDGFPVTSISTVECTTLVEEHLEVTK